MTWSESNPNVGTLLSTFFLEPDEVFLFSILVSKPESMFFGGILDNGARVLPDTAGRGGRSDREDFPTVPRGGKSERNDSLDFSLSAATAVNTCFLPRTSRELSFRTISGVA